MIIKHLKKTENSLFVLFLIISVSIVGYLNLTANSPYDYGDGVQHYLIARYSWKHSHLFLDLWGKPLFTLFASPFAQFGWKGIIVFQLLCGIITSIFGFLIAQKLEFKASYLIPVFIFFSPIYFNVINTGLTELFFSCLLILSLWFFVTKKYSASVILYSFLPYARIEGVFVMPLMVIGLYLKEKIKLVPLLFTGTIIITLIGWPYYKDWLWVIHKNYSIGKDYDIKGSFFHYFKQYKLIFGLWHTYALLLGIMWILIDFFIKHKKEYIVEKGMLIGHLVLIFLAHSFFFWFPDINSNLGMLRFLSMVVPLSAILSTNMFNFNFDFSTKYSKYSKHFILGFSSIYAILLIKQIFNPYTYPYQASDEETVIQHSLPFIKKLNPENKKIYYHHPLFPYLLKFDPFDSNKSITFYAGTLQEYSSIPDSSIILWDSHCGPQEGGTPINELIQNSNYHLQKVFKHFSTKFAVAIFIKHSNAHYTIKPDTEFVFTPKEGKIEKLEELKDFNVPIQHPLQKDNPFLSPPYSICFSNDNEFGPVSFERRTTNDWFIGFSAVINAFPMDSMSKVILVTHIVDTTNDETRYWNGFNFPDTLKLNEWNRFEIKATINYSLKPKEKVSIYIWNFGKRRFCVDDIRFTYYYIPQN